MPRFAANISMMFTEVPFLERFAAASSAGFKAVEYAFPYDFEPSAIREQLDAHGLTQALFNMPPGDWEAGERGLASLPGRQEEFAASVDLALDYADVIASPLLHAMAGIAPGDDLECRRTYVANIRHAAQSAQTRGHKVLIEPINRHDMPGYFLSSVAQAMAILAEVDHPNAWLLLDLYHAQMTDGDIAHLIVDVAPRIGHVQLASVPERHEPNQGELNYPYVLEVLDRHYSGWIGCEYRPAGGTAAGLGWLEQYGQPAHAASEHPSDPLRFVSGPL